MQSGRPAILQEWDNLVKDYPAVFQYKDHQTLRVNVDALGSMTIKLTNILHLFITYPASSYQIEIYRRSTEIPAVVHYTPERLFNFIDTRATEQICDDFLKIKSATLFGCLVSAAALHGRHFCYDTITEKVLHAMQGSMVKRVSIAESYFEIVKLIYLMTQREDLVRKLIPVLMKILIKFNSVEKLLDVDGLFSKIVIEADHPAHSFLHAIFDAASVDTDDRWNFNADRLLHYYDEKSLIHYNDQGVSLLAVCNQYEYFESFAALLKKHSKDYLTEMKVIMRAACKTGCLRKIQFLLRQDKDGQLAKVLKENFADNPASSSLPFKLFHCFRNQGKALSLPLETLPQRGFTCGIYAAHGAARFLRMLYQDQFATELLPPRRKDVTPRAKYSLLGKAKRDGLTQIGEVYSTETMTDIIRYTECQAVTFDILSQEHFLAIIHLAIEQDLPVLLPFSCDEDVKRGEANLKLAADSAHWAVIIGYNDCYLLTAQYNYLMQDKNENYFRASYDIKLDIPTTLYEKDELHEWQSTTIKIKPAELRKGQVVIEKVSLANFRRRLIVMLPPKHNVEKWRNEFDKLLSERQQRSCCKL